MPSTQTTVKCNKKNTKRNNKNRNKRRRKLRHQRKFQTRNCSTSTKSKVHQKQNEQEQTTNSCVTVKKTWETLCLETYQRLTTWQSEAELNFWKARAEWLQNENRQLKHQLKQQEELKKSDLNKNDTPKADTEIEDTDTAYLEFINITHQHREELRRAREKRKEESGVD